jgi:hypothetical protein
MRSQDALTIRLLLALGALIVVPVGVRLLDRARAHRLPALVPVVCCIGYAAAVIVGSGAVALVLALPFAATTGFLAVIEAVELLHRPTIERLGVALATAWLAAAASVTCFALTAGGAPLTPEHLRWPTPAHFLFSGFGLTTIALCVHRDRRRTGSLLALLAVLVAMPVLAVEIAWVPTTQWTGAVAMATAAVLVAGQQLLVAWRARGVVRALLVVSSGSIAAAMAFAVAYGVATRYAVVSPSLTTMVRVHGVLNSVGFVLVGIVAWRVRTRRASTVAPTALAVGRP